MTETEIKAELYDLRTHTCHGRLILHDGHRVPDHKPCAGCLRILALESMLRAKAANQQ